MFPRVMKTQFKKINYLPHSVIIINVSLVVKHQISLTNPLFLKIGTLSLFYLPNTTVTDKNAFLFVILVLAYTDIGEGKFDYAIESSCLEKQHRQVLSFLSEFIINQKSDNE